MGSPAKKIKDEKTSDVVDISTDREQRLSKNFKDPVLEDMIPGLVERSEPSSVMEEAVAAVHELVKEVGKEVGQEASPDPEALDLSLDFSESEGPRPLPMNVNPKAGLEVENSENSLLMALPDDCHEEPISGLMFDSNVETGQGTILWQMAEKLFQLVVSERSFEDLAEAALSAMMGALGAQAGSLLEFDQTHQDFFFRACVGGASPPEKLKAFRVPVSKGIVGHVAESRQPLLVRNLDEDQLQMRAISMSVGFEATTCMAAPVIVGGQLYGVIELFNRTDGSHFEERDLRILECGVKMISKVLEVRFLMAELMRRTS